MISSEKRQQLTGSKELGVGNLDELGCGYLMFYSKRWVYVFNLCLFIMVFTY